MPERYDTAYIAYKGRVEEELLRLLPEETSIFEDGRIPSLMSTSMRYSLLAGGKRIRPVLMLAVVDMLGGDLEEALPMAAALEMIHTYSLIHDDLPGMDDDDMRRGRPTNHKVYGVGQAILAGDGLLNYAYECMLKNALEHPEHLTRHVSAMQIIAERAGVKGMIAGQCIDLLSENGTPDLDRLIYIDNHKTADLLTAPLLGGAALCSADEESIRALEIYGQKMGMAFQIDDDLLDVEGDAILLGKATGMDEKMGKMTWPGLTGIEESRARAQMLWVEAQNALSPFGNKAWFLKAFAKKLAVRRM
ncbi:MAG: polyprenyl synthetase family protein [Clostridia bacterium]|nr:polyprenyl synthetase family protein [Clostridia bacterium]